MKPEKYGVKMQGLKKAAGEVMAEYHVDVNDWTRYHSNSIISVCNAREPVTMQGIADAIALALDN